MGMLTKRAPHPFEDEDGSDDVLVSPACGKDTAASIPGAELMLINGMGHDLPSELYQTHRGALDGRG